MKKVLFLFMMLFGVVSSYVFGKDYPYNEIVNLQGEYSDPQGVVSSELFQMSEVDKIVKRLVYNILREENSLRFYNENREFVWEEIPDFIEQVKKLSIEDFSFLSRGKKLSLSISSADFKTFDRNGHVRKLSMECGEPSLLVGDLSFLIADGCAGNISLRVKSLYYFEDLKNYVLAIMPDDIHFTKIKIDVVNHKLSGKIKVKFGNNPKVKLKLKGYSTYNKAEQTIEIRLDRVKVGLISVKKQFFDELEKNETDRFIIERPYIYIKM